MGWRKRRRSPSLAASRRPSLVPASPSVRFSPSRLHRREQELLSRKFAKRQGVTAKEFEKQFFFSARPTSLLTRFETTQEIGDIVAFVASAQANVINDAAVRAEGGVLTSIL